MAGWYEMSRSSDGQWYFVLKSGSDVTILRSEMYRSRDSANNGVASVQKNCANDARYVKKEAANGKHFFNLRAGNHQVIGTSVMFDSAALRDAGIHSAKASGVSTVVKDLT